MLRNNLGLFSQIWTLFGQIFRNFLKMFPNIFYAIFLPKMTIRYIFHQIVPKNPRKLQEKISHKISKNSNKKYNNNHNFQFFGKLKIFWKILWKVFFILSQLTKKWRLKDFSNFAYSFEKWSIFSIFFAYCATLWRHYS